MKRRLHESMEKLKTKFIASNFNLKLSKDHFEKFKNKMRTYQLKNN